MGKGIFDEVNDGDTLVALAIAETLRMAGACPGAAISATYDVCHHHGWDDQRIDDAMTKAQVHASFYHGLTTTKDIN